MPHPNAWWLGDFQGRELKKYCYMIYVVYVMKYFYKFLSILLGIVVSALAFHTRGLGSVPRLGKFQINFFSFLSFSSYRNHQTFLIKSAAFKINQILSPERTSERKGVSTVERFILVNLHILSRSFIRHPRDWNESYLQVLVSLSIENWTDGPKCETYELPQKWEFF